MGYDTFTKFLAHCNGVDGETTFIDELGHTITPIGTAQLDTAQYKFPTASALLNGSSDYLITDSHADFNLYIGAWAWECQILFTDKTKVSQAIFSGATDYKWGLSFNYGGNSKLTLWLSSTGAAWNIANAVVGTKTSWNNAEWYHIALVFDGSTYKVYVDGTLDLTVTSSTWVNDANIATYIGRFPGGDPMYFQGQIDEIRLSKGISRWTSDFIPPIAEYGETITYDIINKINTRFGHRANIFNYINTKKQTIQDFLNKINSSKKVLSNMANICYFLKKQLYNISNDIRIKKLVKSNVKNDIRFYKSWQRVGVYGIQSLGKEYVKVYINEIEQTDVDIDSMNINETVGVEHIASFDLDRPYDNIKPNKDDLVLIKYRDWKLYKGYVVAVKPTDNKESIRIECKDEWWKQNKSNTYFFVGHIPTDETEKYYTTIKSAISSEFSWDLSIGNFVPEIIDCFAQGKSDVLKLLIEQSGNFSYYYDKTGTKQLWKSGSGNIIKFDTQQLGQNLKLYDILNHQILSSVDGLVNKYRVQMGDKVIKKLSSGGANRSYSSYQYRTIFAYCNPAWNSYYEKFAKYSISGIGFDYYPSEDAELYNKVFRVWNLPYINSEVESWSDRFPPQVHVYNNFYNYFNLYTQQKPAIILTDGFTIDYENDLLIFNEPLYLVRYDGFNQIDKAKAPGIRIKIWKKTAYTVTSNPTDNPEEDVTNPLLFFTEKMGNYSETIIKELSLSQLSIQEGGTYLDSDGETQIIPSWNDIEFAKDYANWQLSKLCDEKIDGTIQITLDAACFHNIQLNNRILATNIFDNPVNIISINYDLSNFIVTIQVANGREYTRTVSLPSKGE